MKLVGNNLILLSVAYDVKMYIKIFLPIREVEGKTKEQIKDNTLEWAGLMVPYPNNCRKLKDMTKVQI